MNKIIKYVLTFFISFVLIVGLCLLVNLIPQSAISANVMDSVEEIDSIDSSNFFSKLEQSKINPLLEIYALETVFYGEPTLESILLPRYNEIRNDDSNYIRTSWNMLNINSALDVNTHYASGQNVILRPLLVNFKLNDIKMFNLEFLVVLSVLFIVVCEKQKLRPLWISFLSAIILSQSFLSALALQYIPILLIALITSIVILCTKKEISNLFILLGVITAFFDSLGLGIILFAMPQLVSLIKYHDFEEPAHKNTIKHFLEWLISLILTIVVKTGISYFIYKQIDLTYIIDLFKSPVSIPLTIGSGLYKCVAQLLPMSPYNPTKANIIIFFVIIFVYMAFLYTYKSKGININKIKSYITIGILPILNLILFFGNTYVNSYYMYRILFVTIMAISMIAFEVSGFFAKNR